MLPTTMLLLRWRHWPVPISARWRPSTSPRRSGIGIPAVALRHGTADPTLLHRGAAGSGAFGAAAATDAAAEDAEEDKAADAAGDADDDGFVVVDPGPYLLGGGGASALTLRLRVSIVATGRVKIWRG